MGNACSRSPRVVAAVALVLAGAAGVAAMAAWDPAKLRAGSVPQPATTAVSGGVVLLEVSVNERGVVTATRALRATPPFTDMLTTTVRRTWEFEPALVVDNAASAQPNRRGRAVVSSVLVGAMFRPPSFTGPTLGELPADVGRPAEDLPYPEFTAMPPYPTHARSGGSVLVEMIVEPDGSVSTASVVSSAPPFDEPALGAARQWRFRPAVVNGARVPARVYIVFGFPTPILGE